MLLGVSGITVTATADSKSVYYDGDTVTWEDLRVATRGQVLSCLLQNVNFTTLL